MVEDVRLQAAFAERILVGRSAAGRASADQAVTLAVVASVRHEDTRYDRLLHVRCIREEARGLVRNAVVAVLDRWRAGLDDHH